ncbi:hypothetical protein B566_EDAN010919 [Ephemera danica]|nr:hypothetical protein B566_EDAN010919 [Ephemera danica]
MEELQQSTRAVYFTPELEHRQGDLELAEALEEQFGKLRGKKRKLRMMAVGLVVTMLFYAMDVVSDMLLAIQYAVVHDYLKCIATFAVVYFSSLVTTYISVRWYRMIILQKLVDIPRSPTGGSPMVRLPEAPRTFHGKVLTSKNYTLRSFYLLVLFLLQLAPIVNIIISLKIIWRQLHEHPAEIYLEQQERTETSTRPPDASLDNEIQQLEVVDEVIQAKMHDELLIMGMIKLHGDYEEVLMTFLEDVPQSLLQTSLLIADVVAAGGNFFTNFFAYWRVVAIFLSILGVRSKTRDYTSSVTTFTFIVNKIAVRDPRKGIPSFMRATWHFLIPVGRAASFCYIATKFSYATSVNCVLIYWLLMFIWLRNDFRGWNRLENVVLHVAHTWIFIWVAASSKRPRTVRFYCMYYLVLLVDAISVCIISGVFAVRDKQHVALTILGSFGLICQLVGVIIKMVYYFHLKKSCSVSSTQQQTVMIPYNNNPIHCDNYNNDYAQ